MKIPAGLIVAAASFALAAQLVRAGEPESEPGSVPSFVLTDQFNEEHEVAFPRNRPTILAVADRRGSSQLEGWLEPLAERYEEQVHIDGVADVRGVPRPFRWGVRQLFRQGSPAPILLDWEDTVCSALDYEKGAANLLVLAPEGRIVCRAHGEATDEAMAAVKEAVKALLKDEPAALSDDQQGQPRHEEEHHPDDLGHAEKAVDERVEGLAGE